MGLFSAEAEPHRCHETSTIGAEDAASLSEKQNTGIMIAEIEQIWAESKSIQGKKKKEVALAGSVGSKGTGRHM